MPMTPLCCKARSMAARKRSGFAGGASCGRALAASERTSTKNATALRQRVAGELVRAWRIVMTGTITAIGPGPWWPVQSLTRGRAMPCIRSQLRVYCPSSRRFLPRGSGRETLEHLLPCHWKPGRFSGIARRWRSPGPTERVRSPHCSKPQRSCRVLRYFDGLLEFAFGVGVTLVLLGDQRQDPVRGRLVVLGDLVGLVARLVS